MRPAAIFFSEESVNRSQERQLSIPPRYRARPLPDLPTGVTIKRVT
jgi:hypothetical protein